MNTYRFGFAISILVGFNGCEGSKPAVEPPIPVAGKPEPKPAVEEPDEDTLLARRSIQENCLICHAIDLIESQRLTGKQWRGEVEKMAGWGSPIPLEQQEGVIKYLTASYADSLPRQAPKGWNLKEAFATIAPEPAFESKPADLSKGEASFAANCKNCHGPNGEGSLLGPNLVERPVLTRPTEYLEVIGKGRGRMPMLGPLVDKSAALEILAWLKTKKYPNPIIENAK